VTTGVGDAAAVALGVATRVAVAVGVALAVRVAVAVGVRVTVGVRVAVAVTVGDTVAVAVAAPELSPRAVAWAELPTVGANVVAAVNGVLVDVQPDTAAKPRTAIAPKPTAVSNARGVRTLLRYPAGQP
jgi:hypothetical protein